MSNDQDWETVVFRKKAPPKKKKLTTEELNAARIAGQVETVKKCNAPRRALCLRCAHVASRAVSAGTNKQRPAQAPRRLDDDDFDARMSRRSLFSRFSHPSSTKKTPFFFFCLCFPFLSGSRHYSY